MIFLEDLVLFHEVFITCVLNQVKLDPHLKNSILRVPKSQDWILDCLYCLHHLHHLTVLEMIAFPTVLNQFIGNHCCKELDWPSTKDLCNGWLFAVWHHLLLFSNLTAARSATTNLIFFWRPCNITQHHGSLMQVFVGFIDFALQIHLFQHKNCSCSKVWAFLS